MLTKTTHAKHIHLSVKRSRIILSGLACRCDLLRKLGLNESMGSRESSGSPFVRSRYLADRSCESRDVRAHNVTRCSGQSRLSASLARHHHYHPPPPHTHTKSIIYHIYNLNIVNVKLLHCSLLFKFLPRSSNKQKSSQMFPIAITG